MLSFFGLLLLSQFLAISSAQNTYNKWFSASSTYFDNGDNYGGACGYENVKPFNLGNMYTGGSPVFFKNGQGCGACYEVKCDAGRNKKGYCIKGKIVSVPLLSSCGSGDRGYCTTQSKHLTLSLPAYTKIADKNSGFIRTLVRRVPCKRKGNIKLLTGGTLYFFTLQIYNVGGFAEIKNVYAQVDKTGSTWYKLDHNWGITYSLSKKVFFKQRLNVKIVLRDGNSLTFRKVIRAGWTVGKTYTASGQFY